MAGSTSAATHLDSTQSTRLASRLLFGCTSSLFQEWSVALPLSLETPRDRNHYDRLSPRTPKCERALSYRRPRGVDVVEQENAPRNLPPRRDCERAEKVRSPSRAGERRLGLRSPHLAYELGHGKVEIRREAFRDLLRGIPPPSDGARPVLRDRNDARRLAHRGPDPWALGGSARDLSEERKDTSIAAILEAKHGVTDGTRVQGARCRTGEPGSRPAVGAAEETSERAVPR